MLKKRERNEKEFPAIISTGRDGVLLGTGRIRHHGRVDEDHDAGGELDLEANGGGRERGSRSRRRGDGAPRRLPLAPEVQLQVMHIIQESLSNARKHAGAKNVEVEMLRGTVYRFWLRDDGKGFVPETSGDGLGLWSIRSRAETLGGSLRIESSPGKGTRLEVGIERNAPSA